MTILDDDGQTRSEIAVREALISLTRGLSPISASGGWFPTHVIAARAGIEVTTTRMRLRELSYAGIVDGHRRPSQQRGGGNHQDMWRLRK